jgi:hypothetical protein
LHDTYRRKAKTAKAMQPARYQRTVHYLGGDRRDSSPNYGADHRRQQSVVQAALLHVWTNCYHLYPAHAAFGGYKQSGIGRENHKMMLDHYHQTKNMLVSYSPKALGFF